MKKLGLICLLSFFTLTMKAQMLVTTFTDPCTKEIKIITVPLVGSTTVFLYNKSKVFTATDVSTGVLSMWMNQVYTDWVAVNPCSANQATATATQIVTTTVSTLIASSVAATPPPSISVSTAPAPAPSSSGSASGSSSSGESTSSSESESESESSGDSKPKTKSSAKSNKASNPIMMSSDFTLSQNLDQTVTSVISMGMSQSSQAGDSSYGVTGMLWSNLNQFAVSARYTKMKFSNGKLFGINNYSFTWGYSYGTKMGVFSYAFIKPLSKWGVTGINLSHITVTIPHTMGVTEKGDLVVTTQYMSIISGTLFYTRSFQVYKQFNVSLEMYMTTNPTSFLTREHVSTTDWTLYYMSGLTFDFQLTKRFKVNMATKASFSSNKDLPLLFNLMIGSKINL